MGCYRSQILAFTKCNKSDSVADSYNSRSRNVYLGCEVALLAEWVLVDVNDEFVLQQLLGAWTDVPQVIGHEQRGSHDGPQCHLRLLLGVAQAKVPDHELKKRDQC